MDDRDIFSPTILEGGISSVLDVHPPAGFDLQGGRVAATNPGVLLRLHNGSLVSFTYEMRHENFWLG